MKLVLLVARRELVEALRQRWLLVTLTTVLVVISVVVIGLLAGSNWVASDPERARDLTHWSGVIGVELSNPGPQLAASLVFVLQALVFNQLLSMTAVMAGHAALHDRQCGTLPFLLLAPLSRFQLLLGKVVGALSVPFLVYALVGGTASLVAASYPVARVASGAYLPPSGGWFGCFLLAAPTWSLVTGTVCALVSASARDVRTAQQAAWAVVFFATFVLSPLLVGLMPAGLGVQLLLAGAGLVGALAALAVGSWVIGRDLGR